MANKRLILSSLSFSTHRVFFFLHTKMDFLLKAVDQQKKEPLLQAYRSSSGSGGSGGSGGSNVSSENFKSRMIQCLCDSKRMYMVQNTECFDSSLK